MRSRAGWPQPPHRPVRRRTRTGARACGQAGAVSAMLPSVPSFPCVQQRADTCYCRLPRAQARRRRRGPGLELPGLGSKSSPPFGGARQAALVRRDAKLTSTAVVQLPLGLAPRARRLSPKNRPAAKRVRGAQPSTWGQAFVAQRRRSCSVGLFAARGALRPASSRAQVAPTARTAPRGPTRPPLLARLSPACPQDLHCSLQHSPEPHCWRPARVCASAVVLWP